MKCNARGVVLRAAATSALSYAVGFVGYSSWNIYNGSIDTEEAEGREDVCCLIQNFLLLLFFIFQHSVLKHLSQDQLVSPPTKRILYVFSTVAVLHVISHYWQTGSPLYTLCLTTSSIQALHLVAWLWLASSVLLADFTELFGFKHIQHEEAGLSEPIWYKSRGARSVLQHYRHPVAVGPLVVIFACKVMTTDRLLLGVVFVLYTFFRTSLNYQDYSYLRYVSYPAKKYTFQKVEIRSRATVTREIRSSFCFSEDEDFVKNEKYVSSDTDLGYFSSPTHHKPEYYMILAETKPAAEVTCITTTKESYTTKEESTRIEKKEKKSRKRSTSAVKKSCSPAGVRSSPRRTNQSK